MIGEGLIGVEEVARALYGETLSDHLEHGGAPLTTDWDSQPEAQRTFAYRMARAAISAHLEALRAAGYVVVPREPTEAMYAAGGQAEPFVMPDGQKWTPGQIVAATVWRAMIAAAPNSSEGSRTTEEET